MLNQRDDIGIWRSIPTKTLKELLSQMPDDTHVVVTCGGAFLNFMRGEVGKEDDWESVGFIEISAEDIRMFDDHDADV